MRRLMLGLASLACAAAQTYTVRTEMVAMRDGVKLASDIYLPSGEGKFPVLVVRSPYNKSGARGDATYLAEHGYAVVAQDVRGRFGSEGRFYAFVNEGPDGYDTIEWAASQSWSNGQVGTFGASYLAWDQYLAAMSKPPHLVAMFVLVGGANFYDEYAYPGGVPNLGWPIWILLSASTSPQARDHREAADRMSALLKSNPAEWLRLPPRQRASIFEDFPDHERMYADFLDHPNFDDYWKQRGFFTAGHYAEMKDVPILFLTGWWDYFAEGVLENFAELSKVQRSAKRLVVGPWPHGTGAAACGDASFGESAAVNQRALMADWFDHWMRSKPFRVVSEMPVQFFRMGGGDATRAKGKLNHGGTWLTSLAWPPSTEPATYYYLQSGGGLDVARPAQKSELSRYMHDPTHPVPTIGGRYGTGGWSPNCAQDQVCASGILGCDNTKPLNTRPDVLSFQTQPLATATEVTGKITAQLWVTSDASSTDFGVKLIDVYPNGYAMILEDGMTRVRIAKPGVPQQVRIDAGSVSNLFAVGHRIRVDIASSNFPRLEPNPKHANNVVYHDAAHPSSVDLPVSAPRDRLDVKVTHEMVPMRDGTKLAADVYQPSIDGKHPVLVARSPYNKNGERRRGEFFARNGYVFVAQDVRGRYASEGELYALVNEGRDGYDTIEWAAKQPWSNGKIGTTGASYLGMDQYAAAIERPPHLQAMYIAVAGSDFFNDSGYHGGVRSLGWPIWILDSAARDVHATAKVRDRLNGIVKNSADWLSQPAEERARIFDGFPAQRRMYDDFYAHPTFDSYWKQPGYDPIIRFTQMKDMPILLLSGWYDSYSEATMTNFRRLSEIQKSPKRLIMGPWPHGYGRSECGDAKFGPPAELDENPLQLDWFDHWLKDAPLRIVRSESVQYFRMGPEPGWQTSASWPPSDAVSRRWYLRSGDTLEAGPPAQEPPYAYDYDPKNPAPTKGGRQGSVCIVNQDVRRPDILTLTTGPLEADVDLTGPMIARLWVSTSAQDADFVVKLIDVHPDGYAAPIGEGQIRLSYRESNTRPTPPRPDKPYEVRIDLGATSNVFAKGHRIRLDITSSSFPKLEPLPYAAHNSVWHDAVHPSYVELSVRRPVRALAVR
jgi:putative CocE/NonD family hydrolase